MTLKKHACIGGRELDLGVIELNYPRRIAWLVREAQTAKSWTEFQQRTSHGVVEYVKNRAPNAWRDEGLYQLQLDLAAQIGVARNEVSGTNTPSFGAFLLSDLSAQQTTRYGLFGLLAGAARAQKPVEKESLHRFLLALERSEHSPFPYTFDVRPPRTVYSPQLAEDYDTIEEVGLVAANSPINVTTEGASKLDELNRDFPSLLAAIAALVRGIDLPSYEEIFQRKRTGAFQAAL